MTTLAISGCLSDNGGGGADTTEEDTTTRTQEPTTETTGSTNGGTAGSPTNNETAGGDTSGAAGSIPTDTPGGQLTVWSGLSGGTFEPWVDWYVPAASEATGREVNYQTQAYPDLRQNFIVGGREGEPDLLDGVFGHLVEYLQGDLIQPITEQAEKLEHFDGYAESAIDSLSIGGELYALPYLGNGRGLVYRTDILEKYDIEPPETWQAYLEAARTITAEESGMYGTHYTTHPQTTRGFQEWISHLYQLEENFYVQEDGSWIVQPSADQFARVFEFYNQLFAGDNPAMNPAERGTTSDVHDNGYFRGDYAMLPNGPWIREGADIEGADDVVEDSAVTHLHHPSEGERGTYLEIKFVLPNSHSDAFNDAIIAAGVWTSPESLRTFKSEVNRQQVAMVRTDVEADYNERWQPFVEIFESGTALAPVNWGATQNEIRTQMQNVIYNESDPAQAGQALHDRVTDLTQDFE